MKIEKNIPIPTKRHGPGTVAYNMDVGDSILVETLQEAQSLDQALRAMDYKPRRRKAEGGYRVWRVS